MITFTGLSPEMFDTVAKDNGFVNGSELLELVAKVSFSESWKRLAFDGWKKNDGTKAGLLRLIDLTKENTK